MFIDKILGVLISLLIIAKKKKDRRKGNIEGKDQ